MAISDDELEQTIRELIGIAHPAFSDCISSAVVSRLSNETIDQVINASVDCKIIEASGIPGAFSISATTKLISGEIGDQVSESEIDLFPRVMVSFSGGIFRLRAPE